MVRFSLWGAWIVLSALIAFTLWSPALAGTTGAIQGTVTDADGRPLADVQVSVVSPTFKTTTLSGSSGFYSANGLPVDTYRVSFSKNGFQAQIVGGITVVQDQTARVNIRLSSEPKTLATVSVRGQASIIQPTQTADTYTISQNLMEHINGTPQDPNGFAALNSLPGITTDNAGFPVIRGGASNDVGYEYEGVDNTDVVTGQFLNGLSLNGARSIQLSTGGYDVSNGNTNSGVINQVVKRGAYPGSGEATVRVQSPLFLHELSFDYGNATPNNRFSYYFSFGGQRDGNGYGDLKSTLPLTVGFSTFTVTDDDVANLYYHFGENNANEVQFLSDLTFGRFVFGQLVDQSIAPYGSANGNVVLGLQLSDASGTPLFLNGNPVTEANFLTLYPGQTANNQSINYTDDQSFNSIIDKLAFKRQLSASSFADVRLYKTVENLITRFPYNFGSFSDVYDDLQTQGTGLGFDFNKQLNAAHAIGVGGDYTFFKSLLSAVFPTFEPFALPLETNYIWPMNAQRNAALIQMGEPGEAVFPTDPAMAPLTTFPSDAAYVDDPVQRYSLFVKDLYQPSDRFTADVGLRFDQQIYHIPADTSAQNLSYVFDDAGNLVTIPGAPIGPDVTRPSQVSPRLALSYKLNDRNVVRFSFGTNIEFEPESGIESKYRIDPALANCTAGSTPTNGCFQLLQGAPYPGQPGFIVGPDPTVPVAGTPTNNITNLYQQVLIDQNTNNFQQYTPVRPQRAVNMDASLEHEFGGGLELKVSPYYRKGTDYVVSTSQLLFTLPSGRPVFGPSHFTNAGVNKNVGIEFDLQKQTGRGIDGFLNFTYDNTLANYDSDFFPSVDAAALAAGHYFHVSYIAPVTGTFNLSYDAPKGWHVEMNIPYESGYRYGVGKKVYVFANNCDSSMPAVPVQVLNTDLARSTCAPGSVQDSYYYTDPTNPGTVFAPNITGSRGTPDGDDPGTLHGNPIAIVSFTLAHDIGAGSNMLVGFRVENVLGNYTLNQPGNFGANNPFYVNNGLGGFQNGSGNNPNACAPGQTLGCEPFSYNFGPLPYETEPASSVPRAITVFLSAKY